MRNAYARYVILLVGILLMGAACTQAPREPLGPVLLEAAQKEHPNFAEYRQALLKAGEAQKVLMVLFTAPEWCGPCRTLEKRVLTTAAFKTYAARRLEILKYPVPRGKPENAPEKKSIFLADAFGADGVPTIILVNPGGRVIARMGYSNSEASEMINYIEQRITRTGALKTP